MNIIAFTGREENLAINVLYVDDEDALHEPVKLLLETDGKIHVDIASSALEGLKAIKSADYDAVISDYQMPQMDGLEFLDRIRGMQLKMPFILLTGRGREEVVMEALNRGANYYFQKGGDLVAQMGEIKDIVRESRIQRILQEDLRETRELLESLVQNTDDAILLFDTSGRILKVNSSFERIYGWTAEEAIGMRLPMVSGEDVRDVETRFRVVAETGISERYQGKRLRKDGSVFYASMTISPVRDAKGRIICISGIGRDITPNIKIMEENIRQRELFETTLSSIGDAVITTDTEGNVLYLNPVAQDMLGYSSVEALGRPIRDVFKIFDERTHAPVELPVETALKNKTSVGMANHTIMVSRNGKAFAISDSAAPIRDHSGKTTGYVMVFRDVTLKNMEEAVRLTHYGVKGILATAKSLKDAHLPLLEVICKGSGCEVGEFWLPDEECAMLSIEDQWISPEIDTVSKEFQKASSGLSAPIERGIAGRAWSAAKPILVTDFQSGSDTMCGRDTGSAGLKSALAFPVKTGRKINGIMVLYRTFRTEREQEFLELLAGLADEMGRFHSALISDQKLKTAMDMMASYMQNSLDAMAITDSEGRTLNVNPAFERLYGWKFEEINGRQLPTIPPAAEADYRRNVEDTLKGNSKRFDAVRLRKDGTPVEVSISLFPLRDETGGVYAVASSTRDISESKRLRDVLLLHDTVLRTSPYMFLILSDGKDSGSKVEFANPSFLETTGLAEEEVTGKEFRLVLGSFITESELASVTSSMHRSRRYSGDLRLKKPSGPGIWVHMDVSPVVGENGKVSHWVCGMKDATEVISSREQLREANEKLKLIANMDRHDIRNCLHSILAFAEAGLLSGNNDAAIRSFNGIKDAARRINDHIEQFRNIQTSIEDDEARWQNLADVVSRALAGFDLRNVILTADVGQTEIHSMPFLEKVFHNLVDNSLRHGDHVSRISISALSDSISHKLIYEDNGAGIPAAMKKSVFSGNLADKNKHGLYLVSELLESCGMSISETGESGKGVRFEITVPASCFRTPDTEHPASA